MRSLPGQCSGCGRRYDAASWPRLPLVGYGCTPRDEFGPETHIEYRNCPCRSTQTLPVRAGHPGCRLSSPPSTPRPSRLKKTTRDPDARARERVVAAYVDAERAHSTSGGLMADEWLVLADALEEYGRVRLARSLRALVFQTRRHWRSLRYPFAGGTARRRTPDLFAPPERGMALAAMLRRADERRKKPAEFVATRLFREFGADLVAALPKKHSFWSSWGTGARAALARSGGTARLVSVPIRRVYGWRPKVDKTLVDVAEGRLSFSSAFPVVVSRLDSPRGAFYIVDGYHRVVEAVLRGDRGFAAVVDTNVPRIERTGGAHATFVSEKVPVHAYVLAAVRTPRRTSKRRSR